ncbi:MAG: cadmium-translocating P-type ATPase [Synergistaceae bacterium]|nr:cadmium-translocating P-type ATPase [Synergistaceae bacterium]
MQKIRICLCIIMLVAIHFLNVQGLAKFAAYLVPYLVIGYDVLLEALEGIREREIFDENFLMSIATIGALILGLCYDGDYLEAVAVMLFYKIGELFEDYAEDKTRKNITSLMDIRPDYANLEHEGTITKINPAEVESGSIIVIKPGEKIPIDGVIIEGNSSLNTSALTGESLPRSVDSGDEVISGCINLERVLRVRTTCEFKDSTVSKILELVENASERKSHTERFITRFAKVYTPAVCISAVALAVIPTLIYGWPSFGTWLYRALTFLVISCPCALVISIPLTFFAGIGSASKSGILIKGSNFIELLSRASCVVFDKTGTLTRGVFEVSAVHPKIIEPEELLHLTAHVERFSSHPVALSLRRAYPNESDDCVIQDYEELAGMGVRANVNNQVICSGSSRFMDSLGVEWQPCEKSGSIIHTAIDNKYAGHIVISDMIKRESKLAVQELKGLGIQRVIMLTGDSEASAKEVAASLGIQEFYGELLPADKVNKVDEFMKDSKGSLIFAGDGINDAPVLARADVGIAMGALGSDAAVEAADVVLMDDDPIKISRAIKISRNCMRIARQNIYFSIGIKLLCLVLGAMGLADMWLAVFADVGVMVLAVLNAIRVLFM